MPPRAGADEARASLHAGIATYYSRRVARYGATPLGADWSCAPTQELRFAQLLRLCDFGMPFSLNDIGCGYGALLTHLARYRRADIDYLGVDLSAAMIAHARRRWRHRRAGFVLGFRSPRIADYSVASGIFNVKLAQPIASWERFVAETLAEMRATSRSGFAVNFMAPQEPDEPAVPELYRVAPSRWIRHCQRQLDAAVELIHGYGLGEFTLLIRPRS